MYSEWFYYDWTAGKVSTMMLEYEVWTQHAKQIHFTLLKQPANIRWDDTGDSWDIFNDFVEHFAISENTCLHQWSFKRVEKWFTDSF